MIIGKEAIKYDMEKPNFIHMYIYIKHNLVAA